MGSCRYVLSQSCDGDESDPTVVLEKGNLHLRVHDVYVTLEMEHLGKVKVSSCISTKVKRMC